MHSLRSESIFVLRVPSTNVCFAIESSHPETAIPNGLQYSIRHGTFVVSRVYYPMSLEAVRKSSAHEKKCPLLEKTGLRSRRGSDWSFGVRFSIMKPISLYC